MKKNCTKCGEPKDMTPENFGPDKQNKDGLGSWCRVCCRAYAKERLVGDPGKVRGYSKKYHGKIDGYLHRLFNRMTRRCATRESYIEKGIKNKFESADQLVGYVTRILQVDPRGKECHRIDNDGHYEQGNIKFLTVEEHKKVHREMGSE